MSPSLLVRRFMARDRRSCGMITRAVGITMMCIKRRSHINKASTMSKGHVSFSYCTYDLLKMNNDSLKTGVNNVGC
jgi:hypothetical protein